MSSILKSVTSLVVGIATSVMIASTANAATTLKIQLATPLTADEAVMVQAFADDVR